MNLVLNAIVASTDQEPTTFDEAINGSDARSWIEAMNEEMHSLNVNDTWSLAPLPKGCKPIASKWIYKLKEGLNNEKLRYKARLVAKGFTQRQGIDYSEIFSPVIKQTSIRLLLSMVAQDNLELYQLDVTTFLHGHLEEIIYMVQPKGYEVKRKEDLYFLLYKSIYGLKQSSRCWYKRFNDYISIIGFQRNTHEICVYLNTTSYKDNVFLLIYVDDMLLARKSKQDLTHVKKSPKERV